MAYTSINKPSDYFNTKLYTGNSTGSTEQSITGLGFSPDMVWIKSRTDAEKHSIADTVRGATKTIHPHNTEAEETSAGHMVSFDSDGYTVGVDNYSWNKSGSNYASWCWRGSDSSAVSNTDGSITSTVSANTTAGFSIVSYTGNGSSGSTVGHGLGATPRVTIIKQRNSTNGWNVWHAGYNNGDFDSFTELNSSAGTYADQGVNGPYTTAPTSSLLTLTAYGQVNGSSNTYIAYCFAEKKGYSKFGSYTGNGSANGAFMYTGFKPAMVILKRTDSAENWDILDNKRNTYNVSDKLLKPNLSNAEGTFSTFDMLSNGFKMRNSDAEFNASGGTYIYMAFAESPFTTSTGIPTTAR